MELPVVLQMFMCFPVSIEFGVLCMTLNLFCKDSATPYAMTPTSEQYFELLEVAHKMLLDHDEEG